MNTSHKKSVEDPSYPLALKQWNLPKIPKDIEGYVQSFGIEEIDEYLKVYFVLKLIFNFTFSFMKNLGSLLSKTFSAKMK